MRKTTGSADAWLALLAAVLAAGGATPALSAPAAGAAPSAVVAEAQARARAQAAAQATDRLIVRYRGARSLQMAEGKPQAVAQPLDEKQLGVHVSKARSVAAAHGTTATLLRQTAVGSHVYKLGRTLSAAELQRVVADLKATDPTIEHAEPDRRQHAAFTPDDPRFRRQWPLFDPASGIRARSAWNLSQGKGVVVAVIDTGIRPHRDLKGQYYAGYDFIDDATSSNDGDGRDDDPTDPGDAVAYGECGLDSGASDSSWHGTHVAGTIAARTDNGVGVAGVAFKAKLLPVRVLGKCGGYESDIADGMVWAAGGSVPGVPRNRHPAKVLNLSLGGGGFCSETYQTAIDTARARGAIVVVAAGNEGVDAAEAAPANCSGVIAVGAVTRLASIASYSNYGSLVTISAPGGELDPDERGGVLSTLNAGTGAPESDSYAYYQGTSMATPHVAGVIALMLSVKPGLSESAVRRALTRSARPFSAWCKCGSGMLDAYGALWAVLKQPVRVVAEAGANDSADQAQRVKRPAIISSSMASADDQDWYRVDVPAGARLGVMVRAADDAMDLDVLVYDDAGHRLIESDGPAGASDGGQYVNEGSAPQTVYVQVYSYRLQTGRYQIKLFW